MNLRTTLLAALLLLPGLAAPALADEHHHRGHGEWRGDIGRFHDHDMDMWRGGHWHRGWHEGRLGWWWIVGSLWYSYPLRVEPYPDPFQPPVVAVPPPPAPQYWYYCANPPGYYPYVAACRFRWQQVPAAPMPPP